MANVGSRGLVRYEETFATDSIHTGTANGVGWYTSLDSSDTAFLRAVNTSRGLHAAGALTTTTDNMIEFCGDTLMFSGQTGHSSVEIMLQLDDVSNVAFNFGFNDEVLETNDTLPVEIGTAAWTFGAADAFLGFVYDTGATNAELHCFWANGAAVGMTTADSSVDGKEVRMRGMAPTNSKWFYMKVEMQDRGSGNGVRATFMCADHNGRTLEKVFNTSVDRDRTMCFYLGIENRADSAVNAYIKLPCWEQTIETN